MTDRARGYIAQRQPARATNVRTNRELSALKRMFSLAVKGRKGMDRYNIIVSEADLIQASEKLQLHLSRQPKSATIVPVGKTDHLMR